MYICYRIVNQKGHIKAASITSLLSRGLTNSTNKIAVVTEASRGLGLELVKELCSNFDGTVYLTTKYKKRGNCAIEKLKELNCCPEFHVLDITNKYSINQFISHIRCQNLIVDTLINNSGIYFLEDSKQDIITKAQQCVGVNFSSVVNFTEAILPFAKNGSKIVNISSSAGHLSRIPSARLRREFFREDLTLKELNCLMQRYMDAVKTGTYEAEWGESSYVVSKVALNAYTFILHRRVCCRGIIVNSVHPGYIKSDLVEGCDVMPACDCVRTPLQLALSETRGGMFVWHDGTRVPWDGPDPRGYIDGLV